VIGGAKKRRFLPSISKILALLFGAEIFFFVICLCAGVSLGVRGKPNLALMALAGIFAVGALTSFPVVVGRGLGAGVKRIVCASVMGLALVQGFVALRDMTTLGDEFTERGLALDKEIRDVEFDLEYHDGSRVDPAYRANRARLLAKREEKADLRKNRAVTLRATATVMVLAFLLFVANLILFTEVTKLRKAMRAESQRPPAKPMV
jgi:hypothetical protein